MRSAVERHSEEAEKVVRDIRRATRRQYSAEEKVRIVIAGLRGEESIAELCRKQRINQNLYYHSRCGVPWTSSASRAPPSIAGTIVIAPARMRDLRIAARRRRAPLRPRV